MAKHPSDLELRAQLPQKPPTRRTGLSVGRRRRTGTSQRRTARSGSRGVSFPLPTQLRMRQSAVKIAYSRNTKSQSSQTRQSWAAHGRYLAREGAQREGGKGLGFNAERTDIDLATTLQGWQAAGDARLFKLIVSPENGAQLDLTAHARSLVRQMEHDLATPTRLGGDRPSQHRPAARPCRAARPGCGRRRSAARSGLHSERHSGPQPRTGHPSSGLAQSARDQRGARTSDYPAALYDD